MKFWHLKLFFSVLFIYLSHFYLMADGEINDTVIAQQPTIKNVLIFGDSMTGWMGERLQAYGVENGFNVSTIVWDGSTITKWAKSGKLSNFIRSYNPDAIFICLGLNELLTRNPETILSQHISSILKSIGNKPFVWVGPPSWPGKGDGKILNDWLFQRLDSNSFFQTNKLELPRQSKTNPHPTKNGIIQLVDSLVNWIPNSNLRFKSLNLPANKQMVRGKNFIYRKMNQPL